MPAYLGSCHSQSVRFTIDIGAQRLIECNCSICTKKGILHLAVQDEAFSIDEGESELALYQFGSETARHWFCRHCGIHVFGRPRSAPERYSVNARCLDEFHTLFKALPVVNFDGVHHPADNAG